MSSATSVIAGYVGPAPGRVSGSAYNAAMSVAVVVANLAALYGRQVGMAASGAFGNRWGAVAALTLMNTGVLSPLIGMASVVLVSTFQAPGHTLRPNGC